MVGVVGKVGQGVDGSVVGHMGGVIVGEHVGHVISGGHVVGAIVG